jgi:nitrilase
MSQPLTIAIVQVAPVFNDREASLEKLSVYARQAASNGAQLIVFGETWLTGYPAWLDHVPGAALWDAPATRSVYANMLHQAWTENGEADVFLQQLSRELGLYLYLGVNERAGHGSLFNSLLLYNPEGQLVNHHRKLMPTYTEKLLYTAGDAAGLKATPTKFGRLGGLICWEHWMPITRQAMHEEREDLHLSVWPAVNDLHQLASRHYAFEGRCFVVAAGQIMRVRDLPPFFGESLDKAPDDYLLNGGSTLIGPDGHYLIDPVYDREEVILHTIEDWSSIQEQLLTLDVTGHYARPDLFELTVDRRRLKITSG